MVSKHKHSGWLRYDLFEWREWYITLYLGNFRLDLMRLKKEDR